MSDWLDEAEERLMVTNDGQTNTEDVPRLVAEVRRLREVVGVAVYCLTCTGTGTQPCTSCEGEGSVACSECDGRTYVVRGVPCPACEGDGYMQCPDCEGTDVEDCEDCGGTGKGEIA